MAQDVTVTPSNSPYVVPSPSITYGQVIIKPGGILTCPQPTTVTCDKLEKDTTLA
jgi:hypothetical protein